MKLLLLLLLLFARFSTVVDAGVEEVLVSLFSSVGRTLASAGSHLSGVASQLTSTLASTGSALTSSINRISGQAMTIKTAGQKVTTSIGGKAAKIVTTPATSTTSSVKLTNSQNSKINTEFKIGTTLYGYGSWILGLLYSLVFITILPGIWLTIREIGRALSRFSKTIQIRTDDWLLRLRSKQYAGSGIVGMTVTVVFWLGILGLRFIITVIKCLGIFFIEFSKWFLWLIVTIAFTLLFVYVEQRYALMRNFLNVSTIFGERTYNKAAGVVNLLQDGRDVISPLVNAQTIAGVNSLQTMYNEFNNQDSITEMFSGRRRRRRMDTFVYRDPSSASIFDDTSLLDTLSGLIVPITTAIFFMNQFNNLIFKFQLAIIHPFLIPILTVLGIVLPKFLCFFQGLPFCGVLEILNTAFNALFLGLHDLVSGIPLLNAIPLITITINCDAAQLSNISPTACGGDIFSIEPEGAFYSALTNVVVGSRRLWEEEITKVLIRCEKGVDGAYTERIRDEIVHVSHNNPCPHANRAFQAGSNAILMHQLKIETNCYGVSIEENEMKICVNPYNVTKLTPTAGHDRSLTILSTFLDLITTSVKHQDNHGRGHGHDTHKTISEWGDQLKQEDKGKTSYKIGSIDCDLNDRKINMLDPYHSFVSWICIAGKQWNSDVVQRKLNGILPEDKTLAIVGNHQKRVVQHGEEVIDHVKKLRRDLLVLSNDDITYDNATLHILSNRQINYVKTIQQTKVAWKSMIRSHEESVRALRRNLDSGPLGDCPPTMYTCPGLDCVPNDSIELCPDGDVANYDPLQTAASFVHSLSTTSFDPRTFIQSNVVDCWNGYTDAPNTVPILANNLNDPTGGPNSQYCFPLIAPSSYRLPQVEELGINRWVADVCNQTDTDASYSNCVCPWYRPYIITYDAFSWAFLREDVNTVIINGLISGQWLYYYFFGQTVFFWLDDIWVFLFSRNPNNPPWLVHLFGNLGLEYVSDYQRWGCFSLHLGPDFFLCFMVIVIIILVKTCNPLITFILDTGIPSFETEQDREATKKLDEEEGKSPPSTKGWCCSRKQA